MVKKFPGFPPERQYWQFPTIINGHVNLLSGTEFKVLWYILRHTFGYQKDEDAISIPQIMNGIKKKDGTIIDSGTGIKHRQTVVKALKRLAKMGFISRKSQGGKGKANIFRPIIQNTTPPTEYTPPPLRNILPPPTRNRPHNR